MKLGLVLEGGASRGYFSVGAMDVLMEQNIWADYVIGTSAGIANGVSYVSRQPGRGRRIALEYMNRPEYMGMKHLLDPNNRSLYNIDYVYRKMPEELLPFDYGELAKHENDTIAVCTNMDTGKAEYLPMVSSDRSFKALVASCALPLLFPPIVIGGKRYMDGGIVDPIPVKQALKAGCDRVIVILTRERSYVKQDEPALKLAAARYFRDKNFTAALKDRTACYNLARKEVFELEREGRVFVLAPQDTTGWGRTERDPAHLKTILDAGEQEMRAQLPALQAYLA